MPVHARSRCSAAGIAIFLIIASLGSTASAQDCFSTEDCPLGKSCHLPPAPPSNTSTPTPPPLGTCQTIPSHPNAIILYVLVGVLVLGFIGIYAAYRVRTAALDNEDGSPENPENATIGAAASSYGGTQFVESPIQRDEVSVYQTEVSVAYPPFQPGMPAIIEAHQSSLEVNKSEE